MKTDKKGADDAKKPKDGMLTADQYKDRLHRRLFRTLDYASISVSIFVIYAVGLVAEFSLMTLTEYLAKDEISAFPSLGTLLNGIKIGLTCLGFTLALYHGIRAAWEQYKLEGTLIREDEKPRA